MLSIHSWPTSNPEHSRLVHCSNHCHVRLSFIARSTTVTLSFSIFLAVNLIACNLFSTPQHELFKTHRFSHILPVLKYLHWLKIDQRIQYKVLSLTYKTRQSQKPSYLYNLINLQANTSTRSSTVITLQHPPVNSRLKTTNRSFTYHAPALWNSLPKDLRYPLSQTSSTNLSHLTNHHLLALSASQFHAKLKTLLFHQSFPP